MQDSVGHAAPAIGYSSVTGEGSGIPISAEQNFSISPGSSVAWGFAEPRPITMPESMNVGYGWRPYGSVSGSAEQILPFGAESTTWSTCVAATPGTPQLNNWKWDNGMPPTLLRSSVSFNGELLGHPQKQLVPVPKNAPYNGTGR
ncbi:hypothetical protein LMH87_001394 [Akanthomyces muscarius]|uniref:Uncharacterized protein n=1 Tax=Akanthomyces muscarius TaxID=2231603 RepID=A0A9W8Q480_AKAMU|nr:hypothetical protein LMH87_001394 [Akanthomyces muscarius]KAJ4146835.1 hypothetical protein LMH87_001394 [Akanthomyces muscarius]